jgi:hypothetical protein
MSELPPSQPQSFGSPQANWPPSSAQPIAPKAPKSGMGATKVILIVVGVFLVLGVIVFGLLVLVGWYVEKSTHKDANGQAAITLPFGSAQTLPCDKITEKDLGILIYPGARPIKSCLLTKTSTFTGLSDRLLTSDPSEKVVAFYKDKAGPGAQITSLPFGAGTQIQAQSQAGVSIRVLITQRTNASGSETHIQIDHVTQLEASK